MTKDLALIVEEASNVKIKHVSTQEFITKVAWTLQNNLVAKPKL
jgi:hypothetical protein